MFGLSIICSSCVYYLNNARFAPFVVTIAPTRCSGRLFLPLLVLFRLEVTSDATQALHRLLEHNSGVEGVQRETGNNHHDALEAHKQPLLSDQMSLPSFAELDDAIDGAPEDANRRECKRGQEAFEAPGVAQLVQERVLVECGSTHGLVAATGAEAKVDTEAHEDEECEHLEGKAGHHDIVAGLWRLVRVRGSRGHSTTGSL
jgi:hypothetical protein